MHLAILFVSQQPENLQIFQTHRKMHQNEDDQKWSWCENAAFAE